METGGKDPLVLDLGTNKHEWLASPSGLFNLGDIPTGLSWVNVGAAGLGDPSV
jgi:hypothetical protein